MSLRQLADHTTLIKTRGLMVCSSTKPLLQNCNVHALIIRKSTQVRRLPRGRPHCELDTGASLLVPITRRYYNPAHTFYHTQTIDHQMEAGKQPKKRRLPCFGQPPSAPNLTPSQGESKSLSGSIVSNVEKSGHGVKKKLRGVLNRLVPFHWGRSSSSSMPIGSAQGDSKPPGVIRNDSDRSAK
ncbi:hypothetical protein EDD15DRAFT_1639471 [Pisolithus albus]|nr:hypothetical protein EDD15DRAFT_1639471 [Pisolithus albus]